MLLGCCHCPEDTFSPQMCSLVGYDKDTGQVLWRRGGGQPVPTYNDNVVCLWPYRSFDHDFHSVFTYPIQRDQTVALPARVLPFGTVARQPYEVDREDVTTWEYYWRIVSIANGSTRDYGVSHFVVADNAVSLNRGEPWISPGGPQSKAIMQVLGDHNEQISLQSTGTTWHFINHYDLSIVDLEYWIDPWPSRYAYNIIVPAFGGSPLATLTWDQDTTAATIQSDLSALGQVVSATATGTTLATGRTKINVEWVDESLTFSSIEATYHAGEESTGVEDDEGSVYLIDPTTLDVITSRAIGYIGGGVGNQGIWRGVLMKGGDLLDFRYYSQSPGQNMTLSRWEAESYTSSVWQTVEPQVKLYNFTLGDIIVMWGGDASEQEHNHEAWETDGTKIALQSSTGTHLQMGDVLLNVDDEEIVKTITFDGWDSSKDGDSSPTHTRRVAVTEPFVNYNMAMQLGGNAGQHSQPTVHVVGARSDALFCAGAFASFSENEVVVTDGERQIKDIGDAVTEVPFPANPFQRVRWDLGMPESYRVNFDAQTEYRIGLTFIGQLPYIVTDWISATANQATVQAALDATFGTHSGTPAGPVLYLDPQESPYATSDALIAHSYMLWQDAIRLRTYRMVDWQDFGLLNPEFLSSAVLYIGVRKASPTVTNAVVRLNWSDGEPAWQSEYGQRADGSDVVPTDGWMTNLSNTLLMYGDHIKCDHVVCACERERPLKWIMDFPAPIGYGIGLTDSDTATATSATASTTAYIEREYHDISNVGQGTELTLFNTSLFGLSDGCLWGFSDVTAWAAASHPGVRVALSYAVPANTNEQQLTGYDVYATEPGGDFFTGGGWPDIDNVLPSPHPYVAHQLFLDPFTTTIPWFLKPGGWPRPFGNTSSIGKQGMEWFGMQGRLLITGDPLEVRLEMRFSGKYILSWNNFDITYPNSLTTIRHVNDTEGVSSDAPSVGGYTYFTHTGFRPLSWNGTDIDDAISGVLPGADSSAQFNAAHNNSTEPYVWSKVLSCPADMDGRSLVLPVTEVPTFLGKNRWEIASITGIPATVTVTPQW